MRKLLLLSVVVATIVVPLLAARSASPRRGLRIALIAFALFNVLYVGAVARFVRSPF